MTNNSPLLPSTSPEKVHSSPQSAKRPSLSRACLGIFITTGVSLLLYGVMRLSPSFSDGFNRSISQFLRTLFARLTAWIPFSLAEAMVLFLPVFLVLVLTHAIRNRSGSWRSVGVYFLELLSVACVFLILFIWMFAAGYNGRTIDAPEKLDLRQVEPTAEQLADVARTLVEHINEESANVHFRYHDFSAMPYTLDELNRKLTAAYETFCAQKSWIETFPCRVKPVMSSDLWSYTHITGVYTFFTGEANINTVFPDYSIPYTAAHELAHQRGISREDEANFVAFLVCIGSDDAYIRYSGYLSLYEFVADALYQYDSDLYREVKQTLSIDVRYEMYAYSCFFDKYRDSTVGTISGAVNDATIKIQGSRDYDAVVDLVVAYYNK